MQWIPSEKKEQPETEPKKIPESWATHGGLWIESLYKHQSEDDNKYLYTTPPQPKPLTDEEIFDKPEQELDDLATAYMAGLYDGKNKYKPQREWQSLTDDEIKEIVGSYAGPIKGYTRELFDKIEAKLREKNG
jgi:hypothetical protein